MEGKYRLQRQTRRWARFAQVTVHGEPAGEPSVEMGIDVLGWRGTPYGTAVRAGPVMNGRSPGTKR